MVSIDKKQVVANDLDERIISHIARGNDNAIAIIKGYHMAEIGQIRDFMLEFLDDCNNPWLLNQYFNMAVIALKINLVDLLDVNTKVVSSLEEDEAKFAM